LHQYHPVKPLPFLFTSRFDSIFVQPVATLSIKLASGRNRFWSTNFRMQACSGAIKPYYFVFPQHVSCCCQSKFSFVLLWLSLLCDSFAERQAHFSSIRPSGRMPCFFALEHHGGFVADVYGPCAIFLAYFFLFKLLTWLGTWFLSSFALACNLFIGAFWSCGFCLCSDRALSQGNAFWPFRRKSLLLVMTFAPLVFTCS